MPADPPKPNDPVVQFDPRALRIEALERANRWHINALDLLFDMGSLHGNASAEHEQTAILDATQELLARVLSAGAAGFFLVDESTAEFRLARSYPEMAAARLQGCVDVLIDSGDFAWALNRNEVQQFVDPDLPAPVLLNVVATRNRIRGMYVALPEGAMPHGPTCKLISVLLHHCAYALESAALYELVDRQKQRLEHRVEERNAALEYHYRHDSLTGLANRPVFLEAVERALNRACLGQHHVVLMYLELVLFERVNESYSYRAGDQVLAQLAQRLRGFFGSPRVLQRFNLRPEQLCLARMGSDEFAVMVPMVGHFEEVEATATELGAALEAPYDVDEMKVYVDHNIGLSSYPECGQEAETLIKQAVVALAHAREAGRNSRAWFQDTMGLRSAEDMLLEAQLREAIGSNQLVVHYQPKLDLASGRICGAEALVRWEHPQRGLLAPGAFIGLAEGAGLIGQLGDAVLARVCRQARDWRGRGLIDFRLAVNLSPLQFRQPGLVESVERCVRENGALPEWIELEVTESAITHDVQAAASALERLHATGLTLALDDFGTGYSSLQLIRRFPIDALKIDRSFVRDLETDADDAAIVAAVIAMGHRLRLRVIAEGVETELQRDALQQLGCDEIQGFWFGRPVAPADFERRLQARARALTPDPSRKSS